MHKKNLLEKYLFVGVLTPRPPIKNQEFSAIFPMSTFDFQKSSPLKSLLLSWLRASKAAMLADFFGGAKNKVIFETS